jgi:hypothetical protein
MSGAYLQKIMPMASTKIVFYIYYLLIISPGIHVYMYYRYFQYQRTDHYEVTDNKNSESIAHSNTLSPTGRKNQRT